MERTNYDNRNFTLLTDFYELTMMQGYFTEGRTENVVFDAFYRRNPDNGGYAVAAGLESIVDYIKNLHFTKEDVDYVKECGKYEMDGETRNCFTEEFLNYLANFKFSGDVYAIPEGTIIHPMEPIVKVVAPIVEAQLVETAILNFMNHQSLIATKAARVCYAAKGDPVMEFGLRRAQGPDAGTYGARATIIAGCAGTSNVVSAQQFGLKCLGTHAHSWIMSFDSEYEAFKKYANMFPNNATLLVDTYDVLDSGVPNAIKVFTELREAGRMPLAYGIRIDSGDLAYLSKESRKMLDAAGFPDAKICASSDLDEYLITSLKSQGCQIDSWGVGTNMITSANTPAFGGVYKLSAVERDGEYIPKIKLSENTVKITNPGNKTAYRVYSTKTGMALADIIALAGEKIPEDGLTLFDPIETWKKTKLKAGEYRVEELLVPVFKNGECVYDLPTMPEIQARFKDEFARIWDEVKRFENPAKYYVDLSTGLWNLKNELLEKESNVKVD